MRETLVLLNRIIRKVAHLFSVSGIIKRTLTMVAIVIVCIGGFLSIRGALPFMPVFGISMEPELHAGDLIIIKDIAPSDVQKGDIIVFTVPQAVREYYNYPQVVAHRVIAVREFPTLTFRTQGDNTGEDPFSVRPQDLKGQVSKQISYLGFPLLFFQSQQGLTFIIIALILLALYLYADELSRGRVFIHKSIFAPMIEESQRSSRVLENRIETSEKGITETQQALTSFASAIAEYAEHLKSHTGAIQGLSEASQELKKGAAEQNQVLARLLETMEQKSGKEEETGAAEEEAGVEPEKTVFGGEETITRKETRFPPGCFKSRRQTVKEEEILGAG